MNVVVVANVVWVKEGYTTDGLTKLAGPKFWLYEEDKQVSSGTHTEKCSGGWSFKQSEQLGNVAKDVWTGRFGGHAKPPSRWKDIWIALK